MDWEQIAAHAVLAMSSCCGCDISNMYPMDYLREHLTDDQITALLAAVRSNERVNELLATEDV